MNCAAQHGELGVPFETVTISIRDGDQKKPEYLSKLPAYHVGCGSCDAVVDVLTRALDGREWLLDRGFSAADVMLGATISFGLHNKTLPEHAAGRGSSSRAREGKSRLLAVAAVFLPAQSHL